MYDEDLEKAMIYYLIYEQEEYLLDENDFMAERNKKIIKAINELKAEKKEITILSVKSKIRANSTQVLEYLSSLGQYVYGTNPDDIYNKIMDMSKKRKTLELLQKSIIEVTETENIDISLEQVIKEINKIQMVNEKEKTFVEQVVDTSMWLEKNSKEKTDYSLYTGMLDLDKIICGLHNEELTIIGARPRKRKDNICFANS